MRIAYSFKFFFIKLTLIWSTNASLPKISYVKSIDVYLVFCFIMTFLSVIEFGIVSYMNRSMKRESLKKLNLERKKTALSNHTEISMEKFQDEIENKSQSKIKASSIDNISRMLFPIVFLIFHIIYWTFYLSVTMNMKNFDDET
jgi:hypothetical protein